MKVENSTFCSIITADYFFYIKALYNSIEKHYPDLTFNVLVVDDLKDLGNYKEIHYTTLSDVKESYPNEFSLLSKYEDDKKSTLRWALKPLFIKYLLLFKKAEQVIFLDPDLFFYDSPMFLLEELKRNDVIITPHWRSRDPFIDQSNFDILFTEGLYNAGFFGCNKNAITILDWWLKLCSYKMEKSSGFYVDQAYLNLMPIYFSDQVKVLQHKGCNVSNWNMIECQRGESHEGIVLINNEFPVVFIHFTNATINTINHGKDKLLKPYLEIYKSSLLKHNPGFRFNFEKENKKRTNENIFNKFKALFVK